MYLRNILSGIIKPKQWLRPVVVCKDYQTVLIVLSKEKKRRVIALIHVMILTYLLLRIYFKLPFND